MTQIQLFKNWMATLLVIILLSQCNKKEIENDPIPGEQVSPGPAEPTHPVVPVNPDDPARPPQSVSCTHTIKLSESVVDGSNIPAGSVVCIEAGTRGALILKNFKGTASSPIVFINSGGKTIIKTSPSASYGLKTEGCKFFRFSGTGSSDQYGIKIDGGNIGFTLDKLSTNFEINNMEVSNCGFAGIMAKTDPSCDASTWRANFVMRDLSFHDNYVHNVKGEGFYVGNSFYNGGKTLSCGSVLPHSIINASIFNNVVANSGAEGIQVGCVIEGLKVYGNTVTDPGEDPFAAYQNNGIQIGEGSGGLLYNNIIKNAAGNGIQMMGLGDNVIFNNIVLNSGAFGIFCDERYTPGNGFTFVNNTIVNSGKDGIRLYSELVPMNTVRNNIIIKPANGIYVGKNNGVKITESNNYQSADIATVKFVNAGSDNYQLASGSPAIDQGMSASTYGVTFDYNNGSRPTGAAYDIGAFESNSAGTAPTPDPTPTPTPIPSPSSGQAVVSLTLINADTDKDIATITNGYVINFASLGTNRISIRANTNPVTVGSVVFGLDANAKLRVESGAPYAINGDGGGNYYAWTPALGAHAVTCTPYSSANASGTVGTPLIISFSVVNNTTTTPPVTTTPPPATTTGQSVTSFTLVNADTEKDITTITNGSVINFAAIGTNRISIRANTNPSIVGSAVFGLDANSKYRVENGAPYSLNGDSGGNYTSWTPSLGAHTVTCTPYTSSSLSGTKGTPLSVSFTVVNNTP